MYNDEPVWDPIRDDSRFAALVVKINGRARNSVKTVKIDNFFANHGHERRRTTSEFGVEPSTLSFPPGSPTYALS